MGSEETLLWDPFVHSHEWLCTYKKWGEKIEKQANAGLMPRSMKATKLMPGSLKEEGELEL